MHREVRPKQPALAAHGAAEAQPSPDDLAPVALGPAAAMVRRRAAPGENGRRIGNRGGHGSRSYSRAGVTASRAPRTQPAESAVPPLRHRPRARRERPSRLVPEQPVGVVQVDEEDAAPRPAACRPRGPPFRERAGAGSPRSSGRGSRRRNETCRRRTRRSAGSSRRAGEGPVPFLPLVDVGQPEDRARAGRERARPRCRSPRRGAERGSASRAGCRSGRTSLPGATSRIAMFSSATSRLQGLFSRRNLRHGGRAVDGDRFARRGLRGRAGRGPGSGRCARASGGCRPGRPPRRLDLRRRSPVSRRRGIGGPRPGRRGRGTRRAAAWPGPRGPRRRAAGGSPAWGTPPSCATPRTTAYGGRACRAGAGVCRARTRSAALSKRPGV